MTTHNGYFWDPNQPKVKHFGMVEIDELNNTYLLTIHGLLECILPALFNINFHQDIPIIHGKIGDRTFMSIYNLRVRNARGNLLEVKESTIDTIIKLTFKSAIQGTKLFTLNSVFDTIITIPQFGQQWMKESRIQKMFGTKDKRVKSEYVVTDLEKSIFLTDFAKVSTSLAVSDKYDLTHSTVDIKENLELRFDLNSLYEINNLVEFVENFHRFYTLSNGQKLGLNSILIKETNSDEYQTLLIKNNPLTKDSGSASPENKPLSYQEFVNGKFLNFFFRNKNTFKLPLDYYFSYLYRGNRGDTSIYFILFLSALEVIYNKSYKPKNIEETTKNSREFSSIIEEITPYLSAQKIQFLTQSKYNKTLRDKTIKDKILDLVEISPKLQKLVKDKQQFAEEVKSMRHYLIHEETKNDLEFKNNTQTLRKRVVQLKIILEYHLLIALGLDKETVEKKIDMTMSNFMHFGH